MASARVCTSRRSVSSSILVSGCMRRRNARPQARHVPRCPSQPLWQPEWMKPGPVSPLMILNLTVHCHARAGMRCQWSELHVTRTPKDEPASHGEPGLNSTRKPRPRYSDRESSVPGRPQQCRLCVCVHASARKLDTGRGLQPRPSLGPAWSWFWLLTGTVTVLGPCGAGH